MHLGKLSKRQNVYAWLSSVVKIDICAIVETRFLEGYGETLMDEVLNTGKFTWFGRDRKGQRALSGEGGVGLLVRKSLGEAKVIKVSKKWDIIWVQMSLGNEQVFFAGVYLSPNDSTKGTDAANFIQELEIDIIKFREQGKVIILGDLNSRIW